MNNIFKYLYDKKGKPMPFEYKLLYNIPLNENDLIVNGILFLRFSKITSLPDNLTVKGDLDLSFTNISVLPDNLTVNGYLILWYTNITSLPDNLTVDGKLYCQNTPLATIIKNDPSLLIKYLKQIKGGISYEKNI